LRSGLDEGGREAGGRGFAPQTIASAALAGIVPPLNEVVVDIHRRWTGDSHVGIMVVALTAVARSNHRMGIQVDTTDDSNRVVMTSV